MRTLMSTLYKITNEEERKRLAKVEEGVFIGWLGPTALSHGWDHLFTKTLACSPCL